MTAEAEIAQFKQELARERAENATLGQKLEEVLRWPGKVDDCTLMRWHHLAHAVATNTRPARTRKLPPAKEALTT
jgi:hypothetical protein